MHHKAVTSPLSEMRHRLYQVCIQRSARQTRPTALGNAKAKPLRAARPSHQPYGRVDGSPWHLAPWSLYQLPSGSMSFDRKFAHS